MNFMQATQEAIRSYWDGFEPEELKKAQKGRMKYTKKYFDDYETKNFDAPTDPEEFL